MFIKDVRCPFKTIKSKRIIKEEYEVCVTEQIDFGCCDAHCIYCEYYEDSDYQLHFQKCKRINK